MNASLKIKIEEVEGRPEIYAGDGLIIKDIDGRYYGDQGPYWPIDIIHYAANEDTVQIMHDRGMDGVRDLTDEAASWWLDLNPNTAPYEAEFVPPYVRNSIAWSKHIESYVEPKRALSLHAGQAGRTL